MKARVLTTSQWRGQVFDVVVAHPRKKGPRVDYKLFVPGCGGLWFWDNEVEVMPDVSRPDKKNTR